MVAPRPYAASVSTMLLSFLMPFHGFIAHFFLVPNNHTVLDVPRFSYSSPKGHPRCLHILTILHQTHIKTVQVLQTVIVSLCGVCLLTRDSFTFTFSPRINKSSGCFPSSSVFVLLVNRVLAIPTSVYSRIVLVCNSLKANAPVPTKVWVVVSIRAVRDWLVKIGLCSFLSDYGITL